MNRNTAPTTARALLFGAMLFAGPAVATAQYSVSEQEPVEIRRPKGFKLFGLADFAITSMRGAGNTLWHTTNAGPGNTFGFYAGFLPGRTKGTLASPNGYTGGFFELQLWMLASRSDWSRARDDIPSLEKVKGGGFNARTNLQRTAPPELWSFQARDGSVGVFHSGATTESGTGSCRDMTSTLNAAIPGGLPLMAISDCPPSWPNGVFSPERPVADTTFLRYFNASPGTFSFDDWKIPASERLNKLYGSVQTYGATNDFGREALQRLGEAIPGGSGPPVIEGWAIGVEWAFQTFTYSVPTVADAMFYKVTVVNKSAEVYGIGINYDSLYLGVMARPIFVPQSPAMYAVPSRGAIFSTNNNVNNTNCYWPTAGGKTLGTGITACSANNSSGRGFTNGAVGMIVLKSPIGDLRNKKFTDPTSPFYFPSHPDADDTLTFNVANTCGVGCYTPQIVSGNVRSTWGALAEKEADALGGRGQTAADLTENEYFALFRTEDWPTRWNPAIPNVGGFNKYVPNNWDYNDDGVQDTLHVTSCGRLGCVTAWADTFPNGFPNRVNNAFHGGVGPIKLRAGDTTSYVIAFLSSPDSVSFESSVKNVTALYQNFWLSPEPPCPAKITSAVPTGGNRQFDTNIRLYIDQSVNECQDKFLIEQAKALKASPVAADIRLRVLNPRLVNQIYARALPVGTIIRDTVPNSTTFNSVCGRGQVPGPNCTIYTDTAKGVIDSLYIFKSCDGGATFTNSSGSACIPAPARDVAGAANDFAWQAYAKFSRDAQGRFPSVYNDGSVTAGLTYTYVVVGASFPGVFSVVDSIGGRVVTSTYTARPRVTNAITTNTANSNVANVYVPASAQSGSSATTVALTSTETDTIASFAISTRLSKPLKGSTPVVGQFILADSVEVQIFDSDSTVAGITSTTLRLYAMKDTNTIGAATAIVRAPTELTAFTINETTSSLVVLGDSIVIKDSIAGGGTRSKFRFTRYFSRGPKAALIADGRPVYVTDSLPISDATPAAAANRADFPGLLVALDPTQATRFRGIRWIVPGIGVINSAEANPNVTWTTDATAIARDERAYSRYLFTFADKEYGPQSPFRLDRNNRGALEPAVFASLAARKVASNTVADAATAALLNKTLGSTNLTLDSLSSLKLPFTLQNKTTGAPVSVAVLKRDHPKTAVFGTGVDTVRVNLPADAWVPGDRLYFIETFQTDSTITVSGRRVVVKSGTVNVQNNGGLSDTTVVPVVATTTRVTWGPAIVGCPAGGTCNPIVGIGGTGYTAIAPKEMLEVVYYAPVTGLVTFNFQIEPERTGTRIVNTARDLKRVRVVPNPYVVFSQYEQSRNVKRLLFTHLPPTGTIRIYTASGQFVQQIKWVESDLEQNCQATTSTTTCTATGDLPWNMRTRENLEIGPGFYIFVVSTKGAQQLGKFVIIH